MKQNKDNEWAQEKGFKNYYEYQQNWARNAGYESVHDYRLKNGIVVIKDKWRQIKPVDGCPDEANEIPFAPGYFITPDSTIYHKSNLRKKWIIIKQQTQRTGYNVFQPYISGKRHVKYVHRAMCSAFYGDADSTQEAHHIDGDNSNNHLDNLMWMDRDEHRRQKRGNYNKGL